MSFPKPYFLLELSRFPKPTETFPFYFLVQALSRKDIYQHYWNSLVKVDCLIPNLLDILISLPD